MNSKLKLCIILVLGALFIYWSGYRLDGLNAARANSFVPKDSILLDQVEYDWGAVYIFNSMEKPITAISIKEHGFLWVSRASTFFYHNDDPVKTIGGTSIANDNEKAVVMSIIVDDPEVTFLEVGPENYRLRKSVEIGKPITFSWQEHMNWLELYPIALNNEGKILYEYRYAKENITRSEDLKWYPVTALEYRGD